MYPRAITAAIVLAAAALPAAFAQTFTDCNPLQKTCPSDPGIISPTSNTDFTQGHSGWSTTNGGVTYGSDGAVFTITGDGQAPTMQSDNYLFFGRVDVTLQSAPGVGIISSVVLESDDLDEIDWEFLGGDASHVQSNFFGKGDTSSYDRVTYVPTSDTQVKAHTYSIDWTAERIQWLIDGILVRTLPYSDPLAGGGRLYPQTPMRVKIGNWVGGGANDAPGTVEWAGGKTDFSQAPFVMTVKSVAITNYNPASSYSYSDNSGSWQSINVANGGSGKGVSGGSPAAQPDAPSSSSSSSTLSTTFSTTAVAAITFSTTTSSSVSTTSSTPIAVTTSQQSSTTLLTSSSTLTTTSSSSSNALQASLTTGSSTSTSSTARPVYTGAASSLQVGAAGSLLGVAAAMLML